MENEIEAFNKVSRLLEFIFTKFSIPEGIKATAIGYLWNNKDLLIEIDKKVSELWKK